MAGRHFRLLPRRRAAPAGDKATWPCLRAFFAGYLHQDADIDGGSDPDPRVFYGNIVAGFRRRASLATRDALVDEIGTLVASDDVSEGRLERLGMEVGLDDQSPRDFLLLLRELLTDGEPNAAATVPLEAVVTTARTTSRE